MNQERNRKQFYMDLAFVLACMGFFTLWMLVSRSLFDAPDERMRYDMINFMADQLRLPRGDEPSLIDPIWGFTYAYRPITAHFLSVVFVWIARLFTTVPIIILNAARFASVIYGGITLWFCIKISRKLFKDNNYGAWMMVCLVAFLPQLNYLNAYLNCDSFCIMSTAIVVYYWIIGMENDWDRKACIGLGVGLAICSHAYVTGYGFLLASFIFFTLTVLLCGKKSMDFKVYLKKGLLVFGVFFILAGWWFVRNAILYNGDFLGLAAQDICAELYAHPDFKPSLHWTYERAGISLWAMLFGEGQWMTLTFRSFIGSFLEMEINLSASYYILYQLIFAVATLGILLNIRKLFALREQGQWRKEGIFNWSMLMALIIPNVLNIIASYSIDFQAQGRYSMPMVVPLMYFVAYGLNDLCDRLIKPERLNKALKLLFCIGLFLVCAKAYCIYRGIYNTGFAP